MAVFLICEFDPFHFGHEYIIKKAKEFAEGEPLICIMSGNFTQRGYAACYGKYSRAACATSAGADLVLSLPFPFCTSGAENFAKGALSVISGFYKTGDKLIFGSECGDIEEISKTAENLLSKSFKEELEKYIKLENKPYAAARQTAYEKLYGESSLLSSPNDILGIEYCKAAKKLCPGLEVVCVKRSAEFLSSTEIRKSADALSYIPDYAAKILEKSGRRDIKYAEKILLSHLRTSYLKNVCDGENGLINRIAEAAKTSSSYAELLQKSASSQFTDARIRRVILYSYLNVTKAVLKDLPVYTLLLGADKNGLDYLSHGKKERKITVITKPSNIKNLDKKAAEQYKYEQSADELYAFCSETPAECGEFLRYSPVIIKNKE